MKTVKFSLNELMSEIDESFIEEVYFQKREPRNQVKKLQLKSG